MFLFIQEYLEIEADPGSDPFSIASSISMESYSSNHDQDMHNITTEMQVIGRNNADLVLEQMPLVFISDLTDSNLVSRMIWSPDKSYDTASVTQDVSIDADDSSVTTSDLLQFELDVQENIAVGEGLEMGTTESSASEMGTEMDMTSRKDSDEQWLGLNQPNKMTDTTENISGPINCFELNDGHPVTSCRTSIPNVYSISKA